MCGQSACLTHSFCARGRCVVTSAAALAQLSCCRLSWVPRLRVQRRRSHPATPGTHRSHRTDVCQASACVPGLGRCSKVPHLPLLAHPSVQGPLYPWILSLHLLVQSTTSLLRSGPLGRTGSKKTPFLRSWPPPVTLEKLEQNMRSEPARTRQHCESYHVDMSPQYLAPANSWALPYFPMEKCKTNGRKSRHLPTNFSATKFTRDVP